MKNNYRSILYPLFGLIILSGVLLFLFRNQLLDSLRAQDNLTVPTAPTRTVVASNAPFDLDILKSPRFTSLINNAVNFDFDNICYRPNQSAVIKTAAPAGADKIDNNAATTTATTTDETLNSLPINCVRGNSLPFSLK